MADFGEGQSEKARWQRQAACRSSPTTLFFATGTSDIARFDQERAKTMCRDCPVRAECLDASFSRDDPEFGIWGGLTADERRRLDRVVQAALVEVGLGQHVEELNVLRRQVLNLFGVMFLEPWELTRILESSSADDEVLALLEKTTLGLDAAWGTITPQELLTSVQIQLRTATGFLSNPQQGSGRRRLLVVSGRLSTLAGVLSFELKDYEAAQHWYQMALAAGHEAGDRALCGFVLGNQAYDATFIGGPSEILRLAEGASEMAAGNASVSQKSWYLSLRARGHAGLGDAKSFARFQDRAEEVMSSAFAEERRSRPGMDSFDEARLIASKGNCLILLNQPQTAELALHEALTLQDISHVRRRTLMLLSLASAYAGRGQPEEACKVASDALNIPVGHQVTTITQRARHLRSRLAPWSRHPAVRDLDEQIRLLG